MGYEGVDRTLPSKIAVNERGQPQGNEVEKERAAAQLGHGASLFLRAIFHTEELEKQRLGRGMAITY